MADPNILFALKPAASPQESMQGVMKNQAMFNKFQQQPMQNRLLQAQTEGTELQNQAFKQEMTKDYALFALQDMATDWGTIRPLLASGDMQNANVAIAQRINKILKRKGDPSDTIELRDRLNSGQITPEQAIAEVDGALEGARQAGLIGVGGGISEYQRQNLDLQRQRLDLQRGLTPAQQANYQLQAQRLGMQNDPSLQSQLAGAKESGKLGAQLETKPAVESAVTTAKETAKAGAARSAELIKKIGDEKEVGRILDMAVPLLDEATESLAGAAVDAAGRVVGVSTKGAQSAARLKALEGALIMKMPRMEGPQSNMDQMLYRQMAAQIGDATVPAEVRKAAVETLRGLNQRYSGAQQSQQPAQQGPSAGQVEDGYRFKGGNPADPNNWEPAR